MQRGANAAEPGQPPPARRVFMALLAFIAAVIGLLWLTWRHGGPGPGGQAATGGFACAQVQGDDGSYCDKLAREWGRRTPVSDGRRDALDAHWNKEIEYAASYEPWCGSPGSYPCAGQRDPSPPTSADLSAVRAALARLGFPDAVVRFAGPDDPAPAGSLLYAVRVETACVVGHLESVPSGPHQQVVLGLLPDGRCLSA